MKPETDSQSIVRGRFAPSPTGRMHLGNVFAALMSWLSVRQRHGQWVLRIEDLDPDRSRAEYARLIEDDLQWLGLDWDEGGYDAHGGSYRQSMRHKLYQAALDRLISLGLVYPCYCSRADIMATQAPHRSDGRIVYAGTCRPVRRPYSAIANDRRHSLRLAVDNKDISFHDLVAGDCSFNLAQECGDFVLQRSDGAWAYQLAVVVDDADMHISEVARGCDLLPSAAQQTYIYQLLGLKAPKFAHFPLITNDVGVRLSKRDSSLAMDHLRQTLTPEEIIGQLAHRCGLIDSYYPMKASDLIPLFSWSKISSKFSD